MVRTFAFSTHDGVLGLFQKENDIVHLYVDSEFYRYSCENWSEWTRQVDAAHDNRFKGGDVISPTPASVEYFLLQYAESINIHLKDFAEIKDAGFFYPRVSRGNFEFNYVGDGFHQDIRAYQAIQTSLDDLLYVVEPSTTNFASYGQKIRELLILACTEVEYLLLRVLIENGYKKKQSYSTADYINCLPILKLNEYSAILGQYPNLKTFSPFSLWDTAQPTRSLEWYDAYNSVKHNRGGNLKNANFKNLLDAISAIHILIEAQYGKDVFDKFRQYTNANSIFESTSRPSWNCTDIVAPVFSGYELDASWIGALQYFACYPVASKQPKTKCSLCGKR